MEVRHASAIQATLHDSSSEQAAGSRNSAHSMPRRLLGLIPRHPGTAAALVLVAVAALPGCYESLNSVATPDKLVFYDDLLGDYKAIEPASGRMSLRKADAKSYAYLEYDAKGDLKNQGELRVIKLGDHHFYEITIAGFTTADRKPVYVIGRLEIGGNAGPRTLAGYAFKSRETLFNDPAITSIEFTGQDGKKGRALSMPAAALQAYLAEHAREMNEMTLRYQKDRPAL